ncbi:bifunctional lysylphosphatidylglycerol flippase/synthetase MprF [Nocardia aurantia]|uniref:Phosphatidylglycerol lysyltransferase C-terminal domain-containing protein n=1 Tax=Nocardia aurantia TaxID=2585199 RepID=A0A7K0DL45_9NOCA|nr:DUF2156 domain-containing protein [Nocardia aurantia]MQY26409.1 hypothetical protein [Nocardia aurantia]
MTVPESETSAGNALAVEVLRKCSDNPSAFLALNQGNEIYTVPEIFGFVCFKRVGRYRVQFGGPFADPADRPVLLRRFLADTRAARKRVLALQVQREDAELYAELGMRVNQIGASYAVELAGATLRGKKFVSLRNKISRATRAGLEIAEVDAAAHRADIEAVDRPWLRGKGRHVKELEFLIGEIGGPAQEYRKLFLGTIEGRPVGYLSFAPVYGRRAGWLHDLSRRLPDAPPGVMEAINFHAMTQFRETGSEWLHFGFTPFTGLEAGHELPGARPFVTRVVRLLGERGELVYPSKTQLEYKMKWNPAVILPEYMAYPSLLTPPALWSLLRVTNSV